jgi:hypothetical protein
MKDFNDAEINEKLIINVENLTTDDTIFNKKLENISELKKLILTNRELNENKINIKLDDIIDDTKNIINTNLIKSLILILKYASNNFNISTDKKIDDIYIILYILIHNFYTDETIKNLFNSIIDNKNGCAPKSILSLNTNYKVLKIIKEAINSIKNAKIDITKNNEIKDIGDIKNNINNIDNIYNEIDQLNSNISTIKTTFNDAGANEVITKLEVFFNKIENIVRGGYNKNMNEFKIFKANFKQNIKKVYAKNAREGAKLIAMKILKGNKKSIKFTLIGKKEKVYNYQAYIDEQGKIKIKNQ